MAVTQIPILPVDYPLFDWNNWPNSYAALVPGGPTKAFEKACWNAIIDYVSQAAEAAGSEWRSGAQDPETVKLLSENAARMTAGKMNSLRLAVDDIVQIPWKWEYDKNFRGYLGRPYFNTSVNEKQDVVYPEYFIEMVRHINRVIEILRGTAQTEMQSASQISHSFAYSIAETKPASTLRPYYRSSRTLFSGNAEPVILGDLIDFPKQKSSVNIAGPEWLWAGLIYQHLYLNSSIKSSGELKKAGPTTTKTLMHSKQFAALDYMMNMIETSAEIWVDSLATAKIIKAPMQNIGTSVLRFSNRFARVLQTEILELPSASAQGYFSVSKPEIELGRFLYFEKAKHLARIVLKADARKTPVISIPAKTAAKSAAGANIHPVKSSQVKAETKIESIGNADMDADRGAVIDTNHAGNITVKDPVLNYRTAPVFTEAPTAAKVSCKIYLYNGWDYPEWVNNGLWIKQAYSIKQKENGELEVR